MRVRRERTAVTPSDDEGDDEDDDDDDDDDDDEGVVTSRPRFGDNSQALNWSIPAEMRPSWVGTSWKGSV
jgi:hypothetical protein